MKNLAFLTATVVAAAVAGVGGSAYGQCASLVISPTTNFAEGGTTDIGNNCDDCTTPVALPFAVSLFGNSYTTVNVSSNGTIQFGSDSASFGNNCPLPSANFQGGPTIMPHWDDLRTDQVGGTGRGIFTSESGAPGRRRFNIEWRAGLFRSTAENVNFIVSFYENQNYYDVFYISIAQNGSSATAGVQADGTSGSAQTTFSCETTGITSFTSIRYACPCPSLAITATPNAAELGSADVGISGDDVIGTIALPFNVSIYGVEYSSINASSNGTIQFGSNSASFFNECPLPSASFVGGPTILAHWDDLRTDDLGGTGRGIFTSVSGAPGSRRFNIEWRASLFRSTAENVNFVVSLYENRNHYDVFYINIAQDGSSATAGVQANGTSGSAETTFSCEAPGITSGTSIRYTCPSTQWDEAINGGGDAGDLPATAQIPTGTDPFTSLGGIVLGGNDVDMYLINICDEANFNATTFNTGTGFDTMLWLFNTDGTGVVANDDSQNTLQSTLTSNFVNSNGNYYLAIDRFFVQAVDATGAFLWTTTAEAPPSNPNPVAGWAGTGFNGNPYQIALSGVCFADSGPSCNYDFNQDENVDLLDAQQMAQVFVGLLTPEANWLDGDLNGDENADLTDAQILAAFVVSGNCNL